MLETSIEVYLQLQWLRISSLKQQISLIQFLVEKLIMLLQQSTLHIKPISSYTFYPMVKIFWTKYSSSMAAQTITGIFQTSLHLQM